MSTYAGVALVPTAIAVGLGWYAWKHRDRPGARSLLALMVTLTLWSGGYALELMPSGLPWKLLAAKIQYLGIPMVPLAWMLLALTYTHVLGGVSRRAVAALATIPVLTTALAWTNESHGWIWAQSGLYRSGDLSLAVFSYGPWFAVNVTYSYALMLFASALFLRTLMMQSTYSRQSMGLVVSALLPWLANLSHVTGLSPTYPLDLTPFAFTFGGIGIVLSLRHFRFLELAPVARTAIVDRLCDAVLVVDTAGRVIDLNPAAQLVIGVREGETVGVLVQDLFADVPALVEAAHSDGETTGEVLIGGEDDRRRYAMYVAPIHESTGRVCGRLITLHDITELREAEAKVQYMAYRDALTGLPNRQLFQDRFQQALRMARRDGGHAACLFLDLDDFKKINDHYGHSTGDDLLQQASTRIKGALRETDALARAPTTDRETSGPTLARFGGDEFVVLLQDLERPEDAASAAERIVGCLREPFPLGESLVSVRSSVGIAVSPGDGDTVEILLRNADAAMYAAKNRGGDTIRFFTPEINEQARSRVEIESALHRALHDDELSLRYQPVFDARSGRIVTVEARICWDDPKRGRVPEHEFRKVIDDTALSVEIGTWALRQAADGWAALAPVMRGGRLSLEISARQLAQRSFIADLTRLLDEERLRGDELELGVSEGTLTEDPERSLEVLGQLRRRGVRFAVEDFGTGHFSLSQIRTLSLDVLRIGPSFIERRDDPTCVALIRAIVALAEQLGLEAAAEGVSTHEQLDFLRGEGYRRVQGALLGRALPLERIKTLVEGHEGWPVGLRASA